MSDSIVVYYDELLIVNNILCGAMPAAIAFFFFAHGPPIVLLECRTAAEDAIGVDTGFRGWCAARPAFMN